MFSGSGVRLMVLALALAVTSGCAHVDPQREVLRTVEIEGNDHLSTSGIEEKLALAETPRWPWADPEYFDAGTLAGDRRRLLRWYQANGFYEARVRSRVKRDDEGVDVTFLVTEGDPAVVSAVAIEGLDELPPQVRDAVLAQPLAVRQGERITEADYDRAREELAQRLRDRGYADAAVTGGVQVDLAQKAAQVRLSVVPGRSLAFGRVVISGNVKVPRATILETVRRVIPQGAAYTDGAMADAQVALFDLGVFGAVRVGRGPTDEKKGTVPVVVAVREAPFQTVRTGVGGGLDPRRYEARATGEYTNRNFLGGLRTLRFENRLGYALVNNELGDVADHGVVGSSALDFTQPDLLRGIDANVRVEYEHGLELAYGFDAVRGKLGFPIRLHHSLTFTPSYNLQRFWLEPTAGTVPETGGNCQLEQGDCVLAFLEERLAWDRRDNPIDTSSGFYSALALQQGRSWLGSQSSYDRVLAEARYYAPLPARMVLALRLEGGALFPQDGGSPIMERFYSGGGNSLRAFGTRRLSPQELRKGVSLDGDRVVTARDGSGAPTATRALTASDTVPIGGDALLEATAELRAPIWGDLGLALFVDAGNVSRYAASGPQGFQDLLKPNVGVGLGLRYKTPFGPVRLDAGYRVISNLPCVVTACETATVPESPFALHFAIGEAF